MKALLITYLIFFGVILLQHTSGSKCQQLQSSLRVMVRDVSVMFMVGISSFSGLCPLGFISICYHLPWVLILFTTCIASQLQFENCIRPHWTWRMIICYLVANGVCQGTCGLHKSKAGGTYLLTSAEVLNITVIVGKVSVEAVVLLWRWRSFLLKRSLSVA